MRAFAFTLALVGLGVSGWALVAFGSGVGAGPWVLLPVLCLVWLWLFRGAPVQLVRAFQDLANSSIQNVQGPFEARSERGPGLFAPHQYSLVLDAKCYPASQADVDALAGHRTAKLRVAARTGAVLSAQPQSAMEAGLSLEERIDALDCVEPLSDREKLLLLKIAEGLSDKEIARELNLSPASVRTYNSVLYAKLDVTSRTQAAAKVRA